MASKIHGYSGAQRMNNPFITPSGFDNYNKGPQGLAGLYAMNRGVDPITNMRVNPSQVDIMRKQADLAKSGEFDALERYNNYNRARASGNQEAIDSTGASLMDFRNQRRAGQQRYAPAGAAPAAPPPMRNPYMEGTPEHGIAGMLNSSMPTQSNGALPQQQPPPGVTQFDTGSVNGPMTLDGGVRRISASNGGSGFSVPKLRSEIGGDANLRSQIAGIREGQGGSPQPISGAGQSGSRPYPMHPNDMIGRPRPYGLVYSSGGESNIARVSPGHTGAPRGAGQSGSRPYPMHPNDMIGRPRPYGLVYSSGGESNIARVSPGHTGAPYPSTGALPQPPAGASAPKPAPFDKEAFVAERLAELNAKYPTSPSSMRDKPDYVTARPQAQTPRLLARNPYGVVERTPQELVASSESNAAGLRNLAAPPSSIRRSDYYSGSSPIQNASPLKPLNDNTPKVAGVAPFRNPVSVAWLGLENAKFANYSNAVKDLERKAGLNQAESLELEGASGPTMLARGAKRAANDAGAYIGGGIGDAYVAAMEFANPYLDSIGAFFTGDKKKLAAAAALRKKFSK